jgi:hypothetical protein
MESKQIKSITIRRKTGEIVGVDFVVDGSDYSKQTIVFGSDVVLSNGDEMLFNYNEQESEAKEAEYHG